MQKRRTSWKPTRRDINKAIRIQWGRRGSLLTAIMVLLGLFASAIGVSAATAATSSSPFPTTAPAGQVCKDIDGVNTCVNEAQVDETKPKTVTKTNSSSKTYEYVMKDGYKTKAKVYSGSSYKAIMSAHPNAKAIRITKNGQKFRNSVHNAAGKLVYFSDYVGSSDSKAGTSSATFYWDAKAKTWRKGNCGNPVKFTGKLPKLSVKQIKIVRELTTTVSATIDYSLTRDVEAKMVCENDAVSAFGYGYASATASIHQMLTATAKSKAQAEAKFSGEYLKLKQSLQQKVWLQASGSAAVKVVAKAQAGCTLKEQTPKPTPTITVTATPTPAPTVTLTPSPAPTQTVIVTPPPVTITYIPVCEISTKKIVSVNQADYDKVRYTTDLSKCNVENPPIVKIPVCELSSKTIVTINEGDYNSSKYSKNLDDCKTVTPPITYIPVCDTTTKTIVSVNQADYDRVRYTTDLNKCKETPVTPPTKITVCELSSKQIVTINEGDYDSKRYSKNLDDCKTVTPPTPQPEKPVVHINQKNDVDQSSIDPGTGKLDESTAPVFFTYTIWGSNSASVKVEAKFGAIRDISSTSVKGEGKVTFTYVAPAEVPKGGSDTITVTLKDTSSGMVASDSTDIVINKTPEIAK